MWVPRTAGAAPSLNEELIWQVWVERHYLRWGTWALGHRYPQKDQMWFFIRRELSVAEARIIKPALDLIVAANNG